jgi:transposase-like protein
LEVSRQELYRWSRDVDKFGERAFPGVGQKRAEETRIAELERKIGQQTMELDFLKKALRRFREQPLLAAANGKAGSMSKSGKRPKRRQR